MSEMLTPEKWTSTTYRFSVLSLALFLSFFATSFASPSLRTIETSLDWIFQKPLSWSRPGSRKTSNLSRIYTAMLMLLMASPPSP